MAFKANTSSKTEDKKPEADVNGDELDTTVSSQTDSQDDPMSNGQDDIKTKSDADIKPASVPAEDSDTAADDEDGKGSVEEEMAALNN